MSGGQGYARHSVALHALKQQQQQPLQQQPHSQHSQKKHPQRGFVPIESSKKFEESVLSLCKGLKYPGVLTKSQLQTLSTPSSWPYIVGFLEWLCGLSLTYESFEDATFYRWTDVIDQQQQQQQTSQQTNSSPVLPVLATTTQRLLLLLTTKRALCLWWLERRVGRIENQPSFAARTARSSRTCPQ
jgi:HEC/Ndc80p family